MPYDPEAYKRSVRMEQIPPGEKPSVIPGPIYSKVLDPQGRGYVSIPTKSLSGTREASPAGGVYRIGGAAGGTTQRTVTTARTVPTQPMPTVPTVGEFKAPQWDEKEIRRLTQKLAAPKLRQLRRQIQRAQARQYENPNVRAMTLREALEGYGLGVEGAMAGARAQAGAEYGQRYGREFQAAQLTYGARTQAAMAAYQNAFNAYLQSMQRVSETTATTGAGVGGRSMYGAEAWAKFGKYEPLEVQNPAFARMQGQLQAAGRA